MRKNNPFENNFQFTIRQKNHLDWEESAVDQTSRVSGGVFDSERTAPNLWWLAVVLLVGFSVIFFRLAYLQIFKGKEYRLLSENNRIRSQVILAPRGFIVDRYGAILAQNTASFNLVAVPLDLPKEGLEEEIQKLATLLGIEGGEIQGRLKNMDKRSIQPVLVKQDISQQQSILFETKASEFIGFSVQKVPIREYPEAVSFSHLLGYTGVISPDDLKSLDSQRYDANDFVGKSGLEAQYEKYLHGENGENLVEVDASGKLVNVLGEKKTNPGDTLVLNIDQGLQKKLYDLMSKDNPNRKAAAIALNPKNGEVLALVSLPGFDSNLFAHGIKKADYQKLVEDKNLPMFNRAVAGVYPPGSTVKPMVAVAALQEGTIMENTVITDRGVLVIPNQYNPSVAYNFYGWKRDGLGAMNVKSAIAESSDIFFYVVAGGHPSLQVQGLGAEKLAEYYHKFNLGAVTGIDLQGEKPGLVPDPDWKAKYFAGDPVLSKWYLGDTYHIGIGQGDLLVTPLQVALWTATIANNGVGYRPRILNKVLDENGRVVFQSQPQVLVSRIADEKNLKIVQAGMRQTIVAGSGRQLASLPITSAGKTGTSQFDGADPKKTHAWFTVYAPYEDPQIVITVLVEAGGEGHAVAAPVAKEVLQWWAENRYNKNIPSK